MEHLVIQTWRSQLSMVETETARVVFQEGCLWVKSKAVPTVVLAARALSNCGNLSFVADLMGHGGASCTKPSSFCCVAG